MSEPPSRFAAIVAQVVALREQLERMVYPGSGSPDYAVYEALYTIGTSIDEQHQALYPPGHDAECQLCFPLDVEEDEKEEEEEDTGDAVEEEEEDEEEDGGDEEEEDEKEEQAMDEDEDEDPEDLWDKQQTRRHRYDHPLLCGRSCCGVEPNDHKQSATCVCDYCLCIKPVPSISKSACTHRERHTEWLYCRAYAQEEEDHDPQTCYSTEHMCQQCVRDRYEICIHTDVRCASWQACETRRLADAKHCHTLDNCDCAECNGQGNVPPSVYHFNDKCLCLEKRRRA